MYNLKIGIIESIDDVLANGTRKLDEIGLSEIQLSCWNVPLCTLENANKIKEMFNLEKLENSDYNYITNTRQIAKIKECLQVINEIENGLESVLNL